MIITVSWNKVQSFQYFKIFTFILIKYYKNYKARKIFHLLAFQKDLVKRVYYLMVILFLRSMLSCHIRKKVLHLLFIEFEDKAILRINDILKTDRLVPGDIPLQY